MEMELLPPFEISQLLLPEKKIKMHCRFFLQTCLLLTVQLLGFHNNIEKIHNTGLKSSSEVWGLGEGRGINFRISCLYSIIKR